MKNSRRWNNALAIAATAFALTACGGGGGGTSTPAPTPTPTPTPTPIPPVTAPPDVGGPAAVGVIAIDGRNWINYRRGQIGIPAVAPNDLIARAAQLHSDYQNINNLITHDEVAGKSGFTGETPLERYKSAGYVFDAAQNYAYGEVISATASNSGFYMAEELITAIYHRFVIFEPMFKEIGTGSATSAQSYTYFTADFAANEGYGPGITSGNIVTWPFNGQVGVPVNFFSDNEAPDPVPNLNEVGYPISVHANTVLAVQSFTISPRGGAPLTTRLLQRTIDATTTPVKIDPETPPSAMSIVPLSKLAAATTYDVTFIGTVSGTAVTKTWSFTTK